MADERYYPQLHPDTPQETKEAIHTAFDNLYSLRDDMQKQSAAHTSAMEDMNKKHSALEQKVNGQSFGNNIQGIGVRAVTANIPDGASLKYHAHSGEFVIE